MGSIDSTVVAVAPLTLIIMKLIVLIAVVALASARPDKLEDVSRKPPVAILSSESDFDPSGTYNFNFESEDGVKRTQEGSLKQVTDEAAGAISSGSYSYTDPDGKVVSLPSSPMRTDSSPSVTICPNLTRPSSVLWSRSAAPMKLMPPVLPVITTKQKR